MSISFSEVDPFPLLSAVEKNYQAEKLHSQQVDRWLQVLFANTGSALLPETVETWNHLDPQSYQTPYTEIREITERLKSNSAPLEFESIVDFGSGYGRWAHVLNRHCTGVKFFGIEIDPHRHNEAVRLAEIHHLKDYQFFLNNIQADDFQIPYASHYFVYDFGTNTAIRNLLGRMQELRRSGHKYTLIARGRATRHFIAQLHPWLTGEHFDRYSIYQAF